MVGLAVQHSDVKTGLAKPKRRGLHISMSKCSKKKFGIVNYFIFSLLSIITENEELSKLISRELDVLKLLFTGDLPPENWSRKIVGIHSQKQPFSLSL